MWTHNILLSWCRPHHLLGLVYILGGYFINRENNTTWIMGKGDWWCAEFLWLEESSWIFRVVTHFFAILQFLQTQTFVRITIFVNYWRLWKVSNKCKLFQYLVQFLKVMTFSCAELVGVAQANHLIKWYWIYFCVFSCFLIWKPRPYIVSKSWKSLQLPNIVIRARNGIVEFGKLPGWGSRLQEDYQSF